MLPFGNILQQHRPESKKCVRLLEQLNKKITNAYYAVEFNRTCIRENLLPKYSNVRLHDRAVQQKDFVYDFRQRLTDDQLKLKEDLIKNLKSQLELERDKYVNLDISPDLRVQTDECLDRILSEYDEVVKTRIIKKLSHLYKGPVALPANPAGFVNLSSVQLTPEQEEFLNLGLNCHFYPKFDANKKKTEDLCKDSSIRGPMQATGKRSDHDQS